jgi:membrane protein DedA with SNARE-associated domain
MIPGFHELLSRLTYTVGFNDPGTLAVLFAMGIVTDIGIPLLFTIEVFLLFASYYVGPLSLHVLLIIGMLLLGRACGGSMLYWFSYALGDPFLHWLKKHFPWLLRGVNKFRDRINTRTTLAVTLVRLTPGFLQIPSLVTGSLRISYIHFILGVVFSSLIYDFSIVVFGYIGRLIFGSSRQDIIDLFIIGFIVFITIVWVVFYFRYRHSFDDTKNG